VTHYRVEGLTFAGGRDLGAGLLRLVPSTHIGRPLSGTEAEELLAYFEERKPAPTRRTPKSKKGQFE
jgi:hypothetical protein